MQEPTDTNLLTFEARYWQHPGSKERAIRETFGLTVTHYWQTVLRILASPDRVAALPAGLQAQCARLKRRIAA